MFAAACTGAKTHLRSSRAELARYKAEHYAAVPQREGETRSWYEFEDELLSRRVVLVGDVHDDASLHARILELLDRARRVASRAGLRPRLFVEFIGTEDETQLADFLAGKLSLEEFRRAVERRWPNSWLGDRSLDDDFYRRALIWARTASAEVVPLEAIPRLPLEYRDAAIARRLMSRRDEGCLDIVLIGHAHLLGEGHLVDALGPAGERFLLVLPNVDVRAHDAKPFVRVGPRMFAWSR